MIKLFLINANFFKISCSQYLEVLEILLLPNVHGHWKVLVFQEILLLLLEWKNYIYIGKKMQEC
jgi:hypothetical protein